MIMLLISSIKTGLIPLKQHANFVYLEKYDPRSSYPNIQKYPRVRASTLFLFETGMNAALFAINGGLGLIVSDPVRSV